MLDSRLSCL
ncbi:hypothetical protein SAMN02799630_03568 [Paenibacillus sp. UNCCL117]|nr:hypothetical protein SAMN02799630_03568 [Paenibacillus sp. UNCCL117]